MVGDILDLYHCQQNLLKDQNQTCVSLSLNTLWLPLPVCGSQHKTHWLLLKMSQKWSFSFFFSFFFFLKRHCNFLIQLGTVVFKQLLHKQNQIAHLLGTIFRSWLIIICCFRKYSPQQSYPHVFVLLAKNP